MYLIFNKVNGCFKKIDKNRYLRLACINESKEKKYEELWSKIRDYIRSIANNSNVYEEKDTKIKSDSDEKLPLNKMIEILGLIIAVRAIFLKNKKYYSQVFLIKQRRNKKLFQKI